MKRKKKGLRSPARVALRKHCPHAWRPDDRAIRDADALAKHTGMSGAELAAAAVMLTFATPQALSDSAWLDPAVQRAVTRVCDMDPFTATDVLERAIRDLHRRGVVTGPDAMAQLCNVEMRRRSIGAAPRYVEPPPVHEGEPDDLLVGITMWEAGSYTEGFIVENGLEPDEWLPAQAAICAMVWELAESGVPVRFETLVPARIAAVFENHQPPPGFDRVPTWQLFEAATAFVSWLGERGIVSPERAPTLTRQLRRMAEMAKKERSARSGAC